MTPWSLLWIRWIFFFFGKNLVKIEDKCLASFFRNWGGSFKIYGKAFVTRSLHAEHEPSKSLTPSTQLFVNPIVGPLNVHKVRVKNAYL